MRTFACVVAVVLSGCESGTARSFDVTVPSAVSGAFTDAARGVVVVQPMGEPLGYVVLCGQMLPNPLQLSQDLGFGCLGTRVGTAESIRAWVQPMPQGWNEQPCSQPRTFYPPGLSATRDGGPGLAANPEPAWAQGSTTANWRRDFSPCGGVLNAALTVSFP